MLFQEEGTFTGGLAMEELRNLEIPASEGPAVMERATEALEKFFGIEEEEQEQEQEAWEAAKDNQTEEEKEEEEARKRLTQPRVVTAETRELALQWIQKFFAGREMYYGGPIPAQSLLTSKYIDFVLYVNLFVATTAVYLSMEVKDDLMSEESSSGVTDDMRWVVSFIHQATKLRVPPDFRGGLMLMYLELCEGIDIPDEVVKNLL